KVLGASAAPTSKWPAKLSAKIASLESGSAHVTPSGGPLDTRVSSPSPSVSSTGGASSSRSALPCEHELSSGAANTQPKHTARTRDSSCGKSGALNSDL